MLLMFVIITCYGPSAPLLLDLGRQRRALRLPPPLAAPRVLVELAAQGLRGRAGGDAGGAQSPLVAHCSCCSCCQSLRRTKHVSGKTNGEASWLNHELHGGRSATWAHEDYINSVTKVYRTSQDAGNGGGVRDTREGGPPRLPGSSSRAPRRAPAGGGAQRASGAFQVPSALML